MAHQLIDVAVEAGANAVKFQTFTADRLVIAHAPKAEYQMRTTDHSESQYEMLRKLELSKETHRDLIAYCKNKNILFMSTPFDEDSADLLADLGVAVFKVASGELTNLSFIAHVARKAKPMIVSTGMANLTEVEAAVNTIRATGLQDFILLHCVSSYPAKPADVNLRAMQMMSDTFNLPVGYSDHTMGIEVAIAAAALGACVIEKHFTIDRNLLGPDHQVSLEPVELKKLVESIRIVEMALGREIKEPTPSEADTARAARKSLVAAQNIPAGTKLTEELIAIKRPGTGLPPPMKSHFLGRILKVPVQAGTLLVLEMLA